MPVTNEGARRVRDLIDQDIDYLGIGTDSSTAEKTDETLGYELARKQSISTEYPAYNQFRKEFYLTSTELNGFTLGEIGLFKDNYLVLEDGEDVSDWSASGDISSITADTSTYQIGSSSMKISLNYSAGSGTATNTSSIGDLSAYTGTTSGTCSSGWITMMIKTDQPDNISSVKYRIGSSATDYAEATTTSLSSTWSGWSISMEDMDITGNPDWTTADLQEFEINTTTTAGTSTTVWIDHLKVSKLMFSRHTIPSIEKDQFSEIDFLVTVEVSNE